MPQTATIKSLAEAFEVVKAMQTDGLDWGEDYRPLGRRALAEIIEVAEDVDRWLGNLDGAAASDRRNGAYRRNLLSELGDIELKVPRTRRYCPVSVIRSYARRAPEIDRVILAGFVLSTRKVGEALLSLLGRPVAPTTVSRVTLDAAVQARRPLTNGYKALMFDGVVLSRKTGAGALKRPVLVVLGLRPDGKKEIVDYRLARAESAAEWERFLDDLYARGLTGEGLEMICVDGGQGLLAALPTPALPLRSAPARIVRLALRRPRLRRNNRRQPILATAQLLGQLVSTQRPAKARVFLRIGVASLQRFDFLHAAPPRASDRSSSPCACSRSPEPRQLPETQKPRLARQAHHLHEQPLELLQVPTAKLARRAVARKVPRHPKRHVLLQLPRHPPQHPRRIPVEQHLDHHPRLIRGVTVTLIRCRPRIQPVHQVAHVMRKVPFRKPIPHIRRQQQQLARRMSLASLPRLLSACCRIIFYGAHS